MGWASELMCGNMIMCDANGEDSFDRAFRSDQRRIRRYRKQMNTFMAKVKSDNLVAQLEALKHTPEHKYIMKHAPELLPNPVITRTKIGSKYKASYTPPRPKKSLIDTDSDTDSDSDSDTDDSLDITNNGNLPVMPFGRHKNKPLSEVPKHYLLWIKDTFDEIKNDDLRNHIETLD